MCHISTESNLNNNMTLKNIFTKITFKSSLYSMLALILLLLVWAGFTLFYDESPD